VLVLHDMLGLNEAFRPRFLKRYAELAEEVRRAARAFTDDVKARRYPGDEHGFE
jgi:3-methyl-2-oxobutanoate hydroxymethyltransferase